jgi:rhodanese-related sulfurtransferase
MIIRRKSILKIALASFIIFVALFFLTGFYEGSVGPDGAMLKQYLPPEKLKALVDKPDSSIWIIDVRPASAYQKGHIPTAKSFPSSAILSRLGELPKDKYLILYCETGGRAHSVMKKLEKQGYTRLMVWGGVSRWPYELAKGAQ